MRKLWLLVFGVVLTLAALAQAPEVQACEQECITSQQCTAICGGPALCLNFHGCRFCNC